MTLTTLLSAMPQLEPSGPLSVLPSGFEFAVGILGFAALFALFGLRGAKEGESEGCGGCGTAGCGTEGCSSCESGTDSADPHGMNWHFAPVSGPDTPTAGDER